MYWMLLSLNKEMSSQTIFIQYHLAIHKQFSVDYTNTCSVASCGAALQMQPLQPILSQDKYFFV